MLLSLQKDKLNRRYFVVDCRRKMQALNDVDKRRER
jgi:hypothetical protein